MVRREKTAPASQVPVESPPVIDFQKVQEDPEAEAAMERRKAAFGMEDGVDLIVKPQESVKIGDTVVSMQEILDKIRLKTGEIMEKDLAGESMPEIASPGRLKRIRELETVERRYQEIERELEKDADGTQRRTLAAERDSMSEDVRIYRDYLDTLKRIKAVEKTIEADTPEARQQARQALYALNLQKETLEVKLDIPALPADAVEAYGIYVVRPGDNIWNIHFGFLTDYFGHRRIALSPNADEPDARGFSSGVGKILKFSENMVYIYNLRDRRLDVDLDQLEPLSKIVIFNMGEVFSMLDPIDYTRVDRIQFDGETLWIPAEP
jgi:hypothetical protein